MTTDLTFGQYRQRIGIIFGSIMHDDVFNSQRLPKRTMALINQQLIGAARHQQAHHRHTCHHKNLSHVITPKIIDEAIIQKILVFASRPTPYFVILLVLDESL